MNMKKNWIYVVIVFAIILLIALMWNDKSNNSVDGNNIVASSTEAGQIESVGASVGSAVKSDINKNNSINKMDTEIVSKVGDTLTVNYVGTLENGTKFDSSIDRGTPFKFIVGIGQVIRGWDEGMLGMKIGEKKHLVIPGEKAYGANGIPDGKGGFVIPPNATLIFDVEMLGIESK